MARRSYQQHCGLASALDVVSQRWAMLIVRDLGPGPRRFSDLFAGLPGISTDMLTERLRGLEDAGALEQVELTSPVPATVYQLTDRGYDLARIGADLARWGAPLLPPVDVSPLRRNARWALQSFASRYRGGLDDGAFRFLIDGSEELTLTLARNHAAIRYGPPVAPPVATVACTTDDFFTVWADGEGLVGSSTAHLDGDLDRLRALLDQVVSVLTTGRLGPPESASAQSRPQ